jgi:DNA-binding NtrC family response regulator
MKYDWPGNVRELENVIERAAVFCQGEKISREDLALPMKGGPASGVPAAVSPRGIRAGSSVPLKALEKAHIEGVLKSVQWEKGTAARILGIRLKILNEKIKEHKLFKPD